MHCRRFLNPPLSRRDMLRNCANGFGAVALTALLGERAYGITGGTDAQAPHCRPRAKNVILLFMDGGPSQMDPFEPKPRLDREHCQPIKTRVEATQFNNLGAVLKSPWKFRNYGQSGLPV